ncbi:YqaJ viral recombinase family protein [Sphaerotilus uruguayifluvii]|uniref:Phage-type endonuclease n=1 Tax=Sphaerotilus uruguayifluvii TaxID=2735897 RepID=A0ABX2G7U6_9BURK|nr:YqaJ viral recombinase family protein [Leptothrix sp. C29]NRT58393.1 putative phage-type endonuclease [Leptothrix sp. C29]
MTLCDTSIPSGALRRVPRAGTAVRLARTTGMSRAEWLQVRRSGIGSSDAAAAVGLSPYCSPLALWLEKTGQGEALPRPDPDDMDSPAYWGTVLESLVARQYTRRTGRQVRRVNAVLQHARHPWMLANLDREVIGSPEVQILECKTAGLHGARLWKDGVPEHVQLQVMHQLAVTGHRAADVAVLLCGQELQIHRIERDEPLIERLIALEAAFWAQVQQRRPPPTDGSDSCAQALKALYPRSTEQTLDLRQDFEGSQAFRELLQVRRTLESIQQREAELKHLLQSRLAQATRAVFDDGAISWKSSQDRLELDVAALLKDQPELLQRYGATRSGTRRFLVQPRRE